jgi:dTDP-4-amino-4,6-dideoxy-D-galactose acyltransferase
MEQFQILEWDTGFFGMTVARILPHRLIQEELERTIALLRKGGVSLAYWASDPAHEGSQQAALACGGLLADRKVTYLSELGDIPEPVRGSGWMVEEFEDSAPGYDLEDLAVQAGCCSRFKVDDGISVDKFVDLYKLWIRNSVNKLIAEAVFVIRRDNRIVGMVTVGYKGGRGDIGLIAVDGRMRGNNMGAVLVHAAGKWAYGKGLTHMQVVTQGGNLAACALYEKCGYKIEKVENLYHFWIMK